LYQSLLCLLKIDPVQRLLLAMTDKFLNKKLSPSWGERSLTRFHPDLCQVSLTHLFRPITGSAVHLTRRVGFKPALTVRDLTHGWFSLADTLGRLSAVDLPSLVDAYQLLVPVNAVLIWPNYTTLSQLIGRWQIRPVLSTDMPPAHHPG